MADDERMLALWDAKANGELDPTGAGARSSHRKAWRCPVADDHRWVAPPAAIARSLAIGRTGCPYCAGQRLSITNSFAARYPDGIALWHPTANGDLRPHQVLGGSPDPAWWKCPAGPDHEWQASPLVLGKQSLAKGNRGCPYCAGKRPSVTNTVASHPQLAAEWHPTANDELQPDQVVAGTGAKLWWRCLEQPEHVWQATGANRVRGSGCPHCIKHLRSVREVCLAYELADFLPELELDDDKVVIDGVIRHVDLLLRRERIVIEVDGRHHHNGPDAHTRDTTKTRLLATHGYRVLRIREAPLQPVTGHDVLIPKDATVKQTADATLRRLLELTWIHLDQRAITSYLEEPEPRHTEEALARLRAERPGKSIRLPGPPTFTRQARWTDGLRILTNYAEREGHANVPWEHIEDGFPLGKWVGAKRAQRRRGRMAPQRIAALAALPGWTWDAVELQWETGLKSLLAFQDREGHLQVPAHYWDEDGFPLGSWVRSHRRRGGRRTMTDEQSARLEAVPGWTSAPPTKARWDKALQALRTYTDREGHCRPPRHHRESGIDIDSWAKRQRDRHKHGQLPKDRATRLEAIPGWTWHHQEDAWEAGFRALLQRVAETGTAAVRRDDVINQYPLGAWVGEQRARHTAGTIAADRRQRLEALPGWTWNALTDRWEQHYTALLAFVAREGHARVPTGHTESHLQLASWVIRHRYEYKAGKVPPDRIERLQALPGWTWDPLAARWDEHFARLQAFTDRAGHARVPYAHREQGHPLGAWVVAQRQAFRTGTLDPDRVHRLQTLPGWQWIAPRGRSRQVT
ncbi:Helicase associated domain protein [Actinotalea solisilvae]|uniref:Helicase associated domain protein n=1 Tax=Actinotalea solisilvae TaxID=2072922 RepID=UPI0018F189EF|nr:Helicase associated domain protein [Actinotalea solisilvae]